MLKYSLLLLAPLGQLSAAVHTFTGLAYDSSLTAGEAGWTLSETNSASAPIAYIGKVNGQPTGALGGELNDMVNASAKLTLASSGISPVASVSFDMLIVDSTNAVPNRDAFGFTAADISGVTLVTLSFIPTAQSLTPSSGLTAQWEVFYTVGNGSSIATGLAVDESKLYSINLLFSGSNLALSLGSSTINTTIAGFTPDTDGLGNVAFTWSTINGAANGDNAILFDNLNIVPEPSSALMAGLASTLLLVRRRNR